MSDAVDLVYLWCDDADPVWHAKRVTCARAHGIRIGDANNGKARYVSNDELRYSLRSADMYVPWIRKVHLVVDDDATLPSWLRVDSERLHVVRHSEILPVDMLPCFNSNSIEQGLFRIEGLAEHFLYACDDMMFGRRLAPTFFFASDGFPICRYAGKLPGGKLQMYTQTVANTNRLLVSRFGPVTPFAEASWRMPHHNVDAYLRSDYQACHELFEKELDETTRNPFRTGTEYERALYTGYQLCVEHGHYRLARRRTSLKRSFVKRLVFPGYADSLEFKGQEWRTAEKSLDRFRPGLFCFNDTSRSTDADHRWLRQFFDRRFPAKSSFEK